MDHQQQSVPMSHVDATWLEMDEPTNLMIINCIMLFEERIDFAVLAQILAERLVGQHDRFSQRPAKAWFGIGPYCWETDPHFDIRSHIRHVALPEPGDDSALQTFISQLLSEPLDHGRPLWRIYLIDNYGEGCAVYGRMHHAFADGIALMQVVLSMTDSSPDGCSPERSSAPVPSTQRTGRLLRTGKRTVGRATTAVTTASRAVSPDGEDAQARLRAAGSTFISTGKMAGTAGANLAKLLIMPKDRESVYRGELTPEKRIAWSRPISLARVKDICAATGTTINDVAVACVTGGLRRYAAAVDSRYPTGDIRATVPVNLRHPDEPLTLGNKFSLVFLTLPVSLGDPYQRLLAVKQRMDALKRSPEPLLVYEILNLLGMVPGPLSKLATTWFASKASCVLTNVPGPRQPVYLAGKRAVRMMFWVPQSRNVGMGISIMSYAGDVTIGLMIDEALVPLPAIVVQEFHAEFEELERVAASLSDAATPDPSPD